MFLPLFIPIPIPFSWRNHSVVQPRFYTYQPFQSYVMVGKLPEDFLRLPSKPPTNQEERDRVTAIHLQNQIIAQNRQPVVGQLEMTFINAVLNKNYGLSRMDPYLRLRIGHHVYETHTVPNGAKSPQWNKTFNIYNIPKGVSSFHIEIFDERTLTDDELIAWAHIEIPEKIWKGEVVDDWFKLSGKLGDGMEGVIHICMAYTTGPPPAPPAMMVPGYGASYSSIPIYTLPTQVYPPHSIYPNTENGTNSPPQRVPIIQEGDIKQLSEMFPSIETTAIKSVLEASNGDKEAAINSLLQME